MKLISMTDFVFLMRENEEKDNIISFWACERYAKFLKQPLKLEMFVPCDKDGNVLEEPQSAWSDGIEQREKAKEKVLFEGCSTMQQGENTIVIFNDSAIWLTWTNRIIEDFIQCNLTLTEKALKQIGL